MRKLTFNLEVINFSVYKKNSYEMRLQWPVSATNFFSDLVSATFYFKFKKLRKPNQVSNFLQLFNFGFWNFLF